MTVRAVRLKINPWQVLFEVYVHHTNYYNKKKSKKLRNVHIFTECRACFPNVIKCMREIEGEEERRDRQRERGEGG